jgi:hypothetical protein
MTTAWIRCESVLLLVALQMETIDYKWQLNATECSNIIFKIKIILMLIQTMYLILIF